MKKIFSAVLFLIFSLQIYSQNNNFPFSENFNYGIDSILSANGQKALWGDISKFDNVITDFDLAKLSNTDLRFLRNMIYAKHGHIFSSDDLTKYYSNFEWYKPCKNVTEADLSENEINLIERIKLFETRDESIKRKIKNSDLTGFWQASIPVFTSGYSDGFVFMKSSKLNWKVCELIPLHPFYGYKGTYEIKGNVLIFSVTSVNYYEGVPNYVDWSPDWEGLKEWGMGSYLNTITFSVPLVFKFPISAVTQKEVEWWDKETLQIGCKEFYKILDDVDKM